MEKIAVYPAPSPILELQPLWCQGNPVKTHFFNALSTMFPQGEWYCIWSIKNYEKLAPHEPLKSNIQEFYAQEKNHAAIHKSFNRALAKLGYAVDPMVKKFDAKVARRRKKLSHLMSLAYTTALEHIAAVLSEANLRHETMFEGVEPSIKRIWIWHAIEEVSHKSLAMEMFALAGGKYWQRSLAMILVSLDFWWELIRRMFLLLAADGLLSKPKVWGQIFLLFLGKNGITHLTAWGLLKFMLPNFNPDHSDARALTRLGELALQQVD